MSNQSNFMNEISRLQNEFYTNKPKNAFFKSNQKIDCASTISKQLDISQLISMTVFNIPNTNKIYVNYELFKTYGNPEIYHTVIQYVVSMYNYCYDNYGSFDVHLNINTFTVSACHRYKSLIELFMSECFKLSMKFSEKLNKLYVYNVPSVFENIATILYPLIDPLVKTKILLFNKARSEPLIKELLDSSTN